MCGYNNYTTDQESNDDPIEVDICRLRSNSSLTTLVKINNYTLLAVVDTAAQVTLISDKVYGQLNPKPQINGYG